jgi:hypothetical protein
MCNDASSREAAIEQVRRALADGSLSPADLGAGFVGWEHEDNGIFEHPGQHPDTRPTVWRFGPMPEHPQNRGNGIRLIRR